MALVSFILMYFATKNLSTMTAFICWSPERISQLYQSASSMGMRVNLVPDFQRAPAMMPRDYFCEAMLLDLACPNTSLILEQASSSRGFNYRHSWLLLHNSSYDSTVIDITLDYYEILPDADVAWMSTDRLVDLYRVKPEKSYLKTNLGLTLNSSRQEMQALWSALPSVVSRRKDLRNIVIKGVTVLTRPQYFHGWSDLRHRETDTFPKLTYPLMMTLAEDLNFRWDLRQVDLYGMWQNGSFSGMLGVLQRRHAEVGLASSFIRSDRFGVTDLISETYIVTCAFIFRQPSRSAVSNVFLVPFSGGVWAASGGVTLAATLLLAALRTVRQRTRPVPALDQLTLSDTCTFALGTLCQQGFHVTPGVSSIRMVMFSTLMTSLFVFTAYSAKIVAILQTPSDTLKTLDDLTKSPMTVGVQTTTYKRTYFVESHDPSTQQLYHRKIVPQGERAYYTVIEGIKRVRAGSFAFQVERTSGYDIITQTFTEREKCGLKEIEAFKLPSVAIPVRKHSGYRELFATRMRWQREVGLMDRARRTWLVARPRCEAAGGGFVSVGIIDVLPAFQVLALGDVLSGVLLATEVGAHAFRNRKFTNTRMIVKKWK